MARQRPWAGLVESGSPGLTPRGRWGSSRGHDHRRRWTSRFGQGHARARTCPALRPAASRYRAALPRRRARGAATPSIRRSSSSGRSPRPARSMPRISSDLDALTSAEAGILASKVAVIAEVRAGAAAVSARFRPPAGRRGARWPRHRHRDLPGCRREAVHRGRQQGAHGAPGPPVRGRGAAG